MTAYYNEFDPHAAAWLRELIKAGAIAPGEVDERSIEDVTPNDLKGFTQHHFFAGIGGWSYALRLAGFPDDRAVWTGSCPCQPFSTAGKGKGTADERHLWPAWHWLIEQHRPAIIFGEQVASPAALAWWDLVQADLERTDYATGAVDLCAASVGAPHIRQRLYWVAHSSSTGLEILSQQPARQERSATERGGASGELGNARGGGSGRHTRAVPGTEGGTRRQVRSVADQSEPAGTACELGDSGRERQQQHAQRDGEAQRELQEEASRGTDADRSGFWAACDWIACRDGKSRPVEPGTFPLAHGISGRVGLLRGYGNAIVPEVAAEFIKACLG